MIYKHVKVKMKIDDLQKSFFLNFKKKKRFLEFLENKMTKEIIQDLLNQLYTCNTSQECVELSDKLAEKLKSHGSLSLQSFEVLDNLLSAIKDKKSGLKREGGLLGLAGLAKGMGRMAEPYLLPCLPIVLDSLADKGQPVKEAAEYALQLL